IESIERAENSIVACDTASGTSRRLTFEGTASSPVVSPDGKTIYFADADGVILAKDAGGLSATRRVLGGAIMNRIASSISPDGGTLAVQIQQGGSWSIAMLKTTGDATLTPFLTSPSNETSPRFSPDGRWLSYLSDESGKNELYVVPFPSAAGKIQVST